MSLNKDKLITLVKDELQSSIENLSRDNLLETLKGVRSQLDILEAIASATFLELPNIHQEKELEVLSQEAEILNGLTEYEESISEDGLQIRGYFTQFMRGGCILHKENPNNVFVPEKIIRDLDLKPGDFVQAIAVTEKGSHINNPRKIKYQFEKLKASNEVTENIRSVESFAIIHEHPDLQGLYVTISPKNDNLSYEARVTDADISKLGLCKGDVIDYSYSPENPSFGKVIWKYKVGSFVKKIAFEPKKKVTKQQKNGDPNDYVITNELGNLHIVTVGGDNLKLHKTAKYEIEKRGGILEYFSGNEPKETIISCLNNADLVVIYTESISHSAMKLVKEHCKKYDIKYLCTKNIGGSILVKKIEAMRL
ncbi:DUF2325 domain-containing protein [Listeria booriae]|uniref:DUF2325 domain-containing protein n=1 Tax=Listeria booriae TaxID=1552123 RepID=UPI0016250048|nr:DUF2325 domain-containing protein [Listeria booriae]MBC2258794.1 DUF2325 domain-containing protein [Listeria booriae]